MIGLDLQKPSEAQVRAARHAYLGAVSYVDDQIGTLLTTLRDAELDADTVVLVLADHGDMLGERGLWYKMNFFEPACRIPCIVSAPGRFAPRRVAGVASLVDILPTLVELAGGDSSIAAVGAASSAALAGSSLVPALRGQDLVGEAIGEYLGEAAIAPIVMIRRGRYKFVHSPVDPDQLYDLEVDPLERDNLAEVRQGTAAHAATIVELRREEMRRWSLPDVHAAVLASQRDRHLVNGALRQGRYTPWDFQPLREASRLYVRNDQELNDVESMARFPRVTVAAR